jgi:tetratricopeptide (TPR) repeat protein
VGSKLAVLAGQLIATLSIVGDVSADASNASELVKQGLEAYKAGSYDDAVKLLQQAYELDPKVDTLFAVAQAERLGGHCPAAITAYKKVIEQVSDLHTAQLVQTNIALCQRTEAVDTSPPPAKAEVPIVAAPAPQTIVRTTRHTDTWSTVLGTTGMLGVGAGIGLFIASDASRDGANHARTLDDYRRFNDRADLERGLSYAALGAGAAMLGVAIFRWVRGDDEQPSATIAITPRDRAATISIRRSW